MLRISGRSPAIGFVFSTTPNSHQGTKPRISTSAFDILCSALNIPIVLLLNPGFFPVPIRYKRSGVHYSHPLYAILLTTYYIREIRQLVLCISYLLAVGRQVNSALQRRLFSHMFYIPVNCERVLVFSHSFVIISWPEVRCVE